MAEITVKSSACSSPPYEVQLYLKITFSAHDAAGKAFTRDAPSQNISKPKTVFTIAVIISIRYGIILSTSLLTVHKVNVLRTKDEHIHTRETKSTL